MKILAAVFFVLHSTSVGAVLRGENLGNHSSSVTVADNMLIASNPTSKPTFKPTSKPTFKPTSKPTTYVCQAVGKAEVWVGYHPFQTNLTYFNQAKIWVITSNPDHYNLFDFWKPLDKTWIPSGYMGDRNCAKFFAVGAGKGAGESSNELVAGVNLDSDVNNSLSSALYLYNTTDPKSLKIAIDNANAKMNANFQNTALSYEVLPWEDWYKRGYGWAGFNANSYVRGLVQSWGKDNTNWFQWVYYYLRGAKKPVPKAFFENSYTLDAEVKNEVFKTQSCTGGKTEVWVGYHNVSVFGLDVVDHAKVWVISSDPIQHAKPELSGVWNDLSRDRLPPSYSGDWNCAKFYTTGSGFDPNELVGVVNYIDDVKVDLFGAVRVKYDVDPVSLKIKIDSANEVMNGNFIRTSLKHTTPFPLDWNNWGLDWEQFNGNGYISGLLKFLGMYGVPSGGNLPGWDKSIPTALFGVPYTADSQVKQLIFAEHPASYVIL